MEGFEWQPVSCLCYRLLREPHAYCPACVISLLPGCGCRRAKHVSDKLAVRQHAAPNGRVLLELAARAEIKVQGQAEQLISCVISHFTSRSNKELMLSAIELAKAYLWRFHSLTLFHGWHRTFIVAHGIASRVPLHRSTYT